MSSMDISSESNTQTLATATSPHIVVESSASADPIDPPHSSDPPSTNSKQPDPYYIPPHPHFHINPAPRDRPIRIYCDGIYDLFHFGHARAMEQAKKAFPSVYLIIGVCSDKDTHERKGLTVMSGKERAESVKHCKWVDQVIEDAPWVITEEFLNTHQIDYVAHDDIPYASQDDTDVYAPVKKLGKFLPTQRTQGISTSDLITRIVKDYDRYLRRNLERGVSPKELNISFLKEQEIRVRSNLDHASANIRNNWRGTSQELKDEWGQWREDVGGSGVIDRFVELYERFKKVLSRKATPEPSDHEQDDLRVGLQKVEEEDGDVFFEATNT